MCCTRLAENAGRKNSPKIRTTLSGGVFATKACIDNRRKNVKHMCSQYGELRPTNGWDRFTSKFQRVSRLALVTAATSLTGGQPNFARCLAVSSWAGTLYIHFGALAPLGNFARCKIHFTSKFCVFLYWQRYCTRNPAAGVSQTLRRGTRNGITKLSHRAPPLFGWAAITLGIGPHSS